MEDDRTVEGMVDEVLARQAKTRAERTGEPFEDALKAVLDTEAGRQLRELRDGLHRHEKADDWQKTLARERAEERRSVSARSSADEAPTPPRTTGAGPDAVNAPGGSAPVPEAWIGRPLRLVFVSGSSTEYAAGDLQEVNDRGIVLSVETHVGRPAQPLFYPWSAVIQLSEQDG